MEGKVEEKIELYCRIYEQIYRRVSKLNTGNAEDIALKILDEVARELKDRAFQKSGKNTQANEREEKLATKKQKEALHKFGVKRIPENLSMKEASRVLNKLVSLSKRNNRSALNKAVDELNREWA